MDNPVAQDHWKPPWIKYGGCCNLLSIEISPVTKVCNLRGVSLRSTRKIFQENIRMFKNILIFEKIDRRNDFLSF